MRGLQDIHLNLLKVEIDYNYLTGLQQLVQQTISSRTYISTITDLMLVVTNKTSYMLTPCPQGFVMEGTKGTTLVRGTAFDLVCLLTNVVRLFTYLQLHSQKYNAQVVAL